MKDLYRDIKIWFLKRYLLDKIDRIKRYHEMIPYIEDKINYYNEEIAKDLREIEFLYPGFVEEFYYRIRKD